MPQTKKKDAVQIKHRHTNVVLYECEVPADVASRLVIRHALEKATASDADLSDAYLSDAYLRGANLSRAATPEQAIANLDRVREIVLDDAKRLAMNHWHKDASWRARTCVEETLCGTTHCLAGWLQVCSTNEKIRDMDDTQLAGILSAPVATSMFFSDDQEALEWLRARKYAEAA